MTRLTQRLFAKVASYSLRVFADASGTRFTNRGATGTITFTLPAAAAHLKGIWYEFEIVADFTVIVAGTAGQIVTYGNAAANNVSYAVAGNKVGRRILAKCDGTSWECSGTGSGFCINGAQFDVTNAALVLLVQGLTAGQKIAIGEHTQAAASDTVVTGLATVVAVVCSPRTRTVKQLFFNASPGDQAGTPAAGSILITSQKPTAVNDVTPINATDFTDNIKVDWIAIGT